MLDCARHYVYWKLSLSFTTGIDYRIKFDTNVRITLLCGSTGVPIYLTFDRFFQICAE